MANGPDIIIKNKRENTCILIDVTIPVDGNVVQIKAEKTKMQEFRSRDTMNVESEINDHASNHQNHQHSNKRFKEKSGSQPVKHSTNSP